MLIIEYYQDEKNYLVFVFSFVYSLFIHSNMSLREVAGMFIKEKEIIGKYPWTQKKPINILLEAYQRHRDMIFTICLNSIYLYYFIMMCRYLLASLFSSLWCLKIHLRMEVYYFHKVANYNGSINILELSFAVFSTQAWKNNTLMFHVNTFATSVPRLQWWLLLDKLFMGYHYVSNLTEHLFPVLITFSWKQ